jgi:hypothetical protein
MADSRRRFCCFQDSDGVIFKPAHILLIASPGQSLNYNYRSAPISCFPVVLHAR